MDLRNLEYEITIKHNGEVLVDTKTDCIIGAINEDDGIRSLFFSKSDILTAIKIIDSIEKNIEEAKGTIPKYKELKAMFDLLFSVKGEPKNV